MTDPSPAATAWWGEFGIPMGETACWRIGGLRLWARRGERSWELACCRAERTPHPDVRNPCDMPWPQSTDESRRIHFRTTGEHLIVEPRLPDRPVVWRAHEPVALPAGEQMELCLRVPLWIAFRAKGSGTLWEAPLHALSETWIGAPTERGGAAYAAPEPLPGAARVSADGRHALTPVRVRNIASTTLELERLNLPVPYLTLFLGADNRLWTQRITLERDLNETEIAQLRLGHGPPEEAGVCRLIARPRLTAEENVIFHAFSRIFQ